MRPFTYNPWRQSARHTIHVVLWSAVAAVLGCADAHTPAESAQSTASQSSAANASLAALESKPAIEKGDEIVKTDDEWRALLTDEQFEVTRQKGTEPAFSTDMHKLKAEGHFLCVCCGEPLFSSAAKFDSGTGWPSYWEPIAEDSVETAEDNTLFMRRVEVLCRRCDAHLGHVFPDGPEPTGLRYCINSVALRFVPRGADEGGKAPPSNEPAQAAAAGEPSE